MFEEFSFEYYYLSVLSLHEDFYTPVSSTKNFFLYHSSRIVNFGVLCLSFWSIFEGTKYDRYIKVSLRAILF